MIIVYKIKGGLSLKYKTGDDAMFERLYARIHQAITKPEPDVVYMGEYSIEKVIEAIGNPEAFTAFVMIMYPARLSDKDAVLEYIREVEPMLNYADLHTQTEKYQIVQYGIIE